MKRNRAILTRLLMLVALVPVTGSWAQEANVAAITQVIDLYRGAPVRDALDALRQRYHLPITYEGPVYACPCDLADMTHLRKTPGPKIIVPRRQQLHFEYLETGGRPQEDITSLIRRLLDEHAAQGGPVFDVRERSTKSGPEWNVVPLRAHGASGDFVKQPDILGESIFIAKAPRTEAEFLQEMLRQLRTVTGYTVVLGTVESRIEIGTGNLGAENISARDILASHFATDMVWDLNYDPEGEGRYILNLTRTPQALPPINPFPVPTNQTPARRPGLNPPVLAFRNMSPQGRINIQSKLAQAGYYQGELNGKWNQETTEALKKFQTANNIPVTGYPDLETMRTLGLSPPTPLPH